MNLYHITNHKNISSIKEKGLIPNFTKGLAANKTWDKYCVWLTDSPMYIIQAQIGEDFFKRHNMKILVVDTSKITVYTRVCHYFLMPSIHEFVCFDTIPPTLVREM